jgi:ArsR family transcriptional regulator
MVTIAEPTSIFGVLSDPTRLEICRRLAPEELCVCHVVEDMGISQSLASHHLKVLRDAGLVETRRHSYWTYYRLRSEAFDGSILDLQALKSSAEACCEARPCC